MTRVLVVDDDPGIREMSCWVFRGPRYEVVTAESGKEALHISLQQRPDVMVIDLKLPDTNALEVIRAVHAAGLTFPIVVITGFGTIASAVEAIRLGAVDYLEKPLDVDGIVDVVERALHDASAHSRSVSGADGLALWATAVKGVLDSASDPKTIKAWASLRGVAPDTLRGWCRTVGIQPKRSLDLARVLRAAYRGRTRKSPPERFLYAADRRTLGRLMIGAGLQKQASAPTLEDVLGRQTFVTDTAALDELRRLLCAHVVDLEA